MPQNNILIIKLGALGDVVQALGPMKAIRQHHPDSVITVLTTKPYADLIEQSGYADIVWTDTRPKWHQIKEWFALQRQLNDGNFARVYDLQNNDRTELYFKIFKNRPEWVGVAKGASHRNTSPERTAGQAFDGHVQTLGIANIHDITIDRMEWIDSNVARFNLRQPYALIVPGSSPKRPEKRWPVAHYIALCQALSERGIQPVLIGTKDERAVIEKISSACPHAVDLTGQTALFDIVPLARGAAVSVGNDTGPMHMIAPTGCPTVILFSKFSNPVRHAPKGDALVTLQSPDLNDLSVETVLDKIGAIMR